MNEIYISAFISTNNQRLNNTFIITINPICKIAQVKHGTLHTITSFDKISESKHIEPSSPLCKLKYFKVAGIFKRQKDTPEEQDENMINFIRYKFAYNLSNS